MRSPTWPTASASISGISSPPSAADVLEGHYSSGLCHLANISHRLGQETPFEPRTRTFAGNQEATELFQSMQDHLRDAGLKMDAARYRLGPKLMLDAKTERFREQP